MRGSSNCVCVKCLDYGKRLDAFEMWYFRNVLGIKWVNSVANERVLEPMQGRRTLRGAIRRRRDGLAFRTVELEE